MRFLRDEKHVDGCPVGREVRMDQWLGSVGYFTYLYINGVSWDYNNPLILTIYDNFLGHPSGTPFLGKGALNHNWCCFNYTHGFSFH